MIIINDNNKCIQNYLRPPSSMRFIGIGKILLKNDIKMQHKSCKLR